MTVLFFRFNQWALCYFWISERVDDLSVMWCLIGVSDLSANIGSDVRIYMFIIDGFVQIDLLND